MHLKKWFLGWLLPLALFVQPGMAMAQNAMSQPDVNQQSPWASDIDWAAYKGKVVYLDFWASWCGPCRQSFPWMNAMQAKYDKEGLVVLAVNVDKDPRKAAAFLAKTPAQFAIKYDPDGQLAKQMAIKTMPTSIVFDRQGQPQARHAGFQLSSMPEYEAELKNILSGKP